MCGIAGFVLVRPEAPETMLREVAAMADTLRHRGPDAGGTHLGGTNRMTLGHRRLAIIDLSELGAQPMTSASGRWTVAFNGEIYNHRGIRKDLESKGRRFRGHSDTETLVEAIDEWGFMETLARTNGMFAIAAFDSARSVLLLARDRLGEKPLYWTRQGERFAFASELRALRSVPGLEFCIDDAAATSMLRWSFIPHPHTIYAGVHQLAPGGLVELSIEPDDIAVRCAQWWSLDSTLDFARSEPSGLPIESASGELDGLLAESVANRLESDVPLGVFLSGGIDSSLIAHYAQRAIGGVSTFTVSMPDIGFDESAYAAEVAHVLGTDHRSVNLTTADALDSIPLLAEVWDEPFGDPSMLPSMLLCRAARRELAVCLGGDGGDELFGGYNRHAYGALVQRRIGRVPQRIRSMLARAVLAPSPASIDRAMGAASRFLPGERRLPNMGDKAQKLGGLLGTDGDTWDVLAGVWPTGDLGLPSHGPAVPRLSSPVDEVEGMMLIDTASVLPDQMMVKVDRASMASSLEVRTPFLDHGLLEWAWSQPLDVKTSRGVGKLVLRDLASEVLPADLAERPKMGFDPPLGAWLRNELRPWADGLLADPQVVARGWLAGDALRRTWREHCEGSRNWEYRLWSVLMLESWLRRYHP